MYPGTRASCHPDAEVAEDRFPTQFTKRYYWGKAIVMNELQGVNSMTGAQQSDAMKNLVLFILGLAVIGTIVAFGWYFAFDLPVQQAALSTPANGCWGGICKGGMG